jgi:hypothetical protein
MFEINDKPNVEELYSTAGNTSDLTVEADRRGAGDVMIAAGWSESRIGMALLRLHSEYDSGEASHKRASITETDAILIFGRLKSLPSVLEQVGIRAAIWGMESPDAKAQAVVLWWLDRVCHRCAGRKFELIPDTPALSTRWCKRCGGSGEAALPYGSEGKRLAGFMDDCVSRARQSMKKRLRPA